MECSEVLCEQKAEVYCECETPAVIYCSAHGYEHFKSTMHEMQDIKLKNLNLQFSRADYLLTTKQPLSISDVLSGPSFFQRAVLKHLKQKSKQDLEKFGIFGSVREYLFEFKVKYICFLCGQKTSYVKLHLVKKHKFSEEERSEYWNANVERYLECGLIMSDVV